MKTRKVVCVWLACLLTVAIGAALARADGPCRLSLVDTMLKHGFKMEVESLLTKSISFVTETYVPQRLKQKGMWLD